MRALHHPLARGALAAAALVSLGSSPAEGGRPVLVREEGDRIVLTDRPDPRRPSLPEPGSRGARTSRSPRRVPFQGLIRQAAARAGVDPTLVAAMVRHESAFDPAAVSRAGAQGLMQLMPATARRFGVDDPFDPGQNLRGGTTYLRWLLDRFGGDVRLAVAAYHAGEGAVARHGGIPPYPETREYVRRVLAELDGTAPGRPVPAPRRALRVRLQGGTVVATN